MVVVVVVVVLISTPYIFFSYRLKLHQLTMRSHMTKASSCAQLCCSHRIGEEDFISDVTTNVFLGNLHGWPARNLAYQPCIWLCVHALEL